jgi:hypothetical protein
MCDVNVCTCPHDELDRTDVSYPYRDTETVKAAVKAALEQHLRVDDDGEVLAGHYAEVRAISIVEYGMRNRTRYRLLFFETSPKTVLYSRCASYPCRSEELYRN